MAGCPHETWQASVTVNRLTTGEDGPVTAYSSDIRANCAACGAAMVWLGVPTGSLSHRPTISLDGTELRAPGYAAPSKN